MLIISFAETKLLPLKDGCLEYDTKLHLGSVEDFYIVITLGLALTQGGNTC